MKSSNPIFSGRGAFGQGNDGRYAGFGTPQSNPQAPYQGGYQHPPAGAPQGPYPGYQQPSPADLEAMYQAPPATPVQMQRMTIDDVVARTAMTLLTVVVGAVIGWVFVPVGALGLPLIAALVAFVIALVIAFKQSTNPALILTYAALEGFFLGAISRVYETALQGAVPQAVIGTMAVFAGMLIAYKSGRIRVTPRFTKIVIAAGIGFLLLMLVNMLPALIPGGAVELGLRSGPLGILVGVFAVGLGAMFLALDFNAIEEGIRYGAPQKFAWQAAFGLTVTLVWIYLEILRLIAILRGEE